MKTQIHDKVSYKKDYSAQAFIKYLDETIENRSDCICMYREPDFLVEGNVLPTFTIVDKLWGVIFIKLYDYTEDLLTEITERYWIISGNKENNKIKLFDNYCYKCKSDIMSPLNDISDEPQFTQIVCFTNMNSNVFENGNWTYKKGFCFFEDYLSKNIFESIEEHKIESDDWDKLNSVIQKANVLQKDIGVPIDKPACNLREAIDINNQQIYQFDDVQLSASLSITDECEQIRGLAGTGKTVILAIKAAKLHRHNENAKIAYVFYTQSLYNQVTQLVRKYYNKLTGKEPNWDNLKIIHAWGGKTTGEGFLYNICRTNGLESIPYGAVRNAKNPFGEACSNVLKRTLLEEYDYVIIDEAQDLPKEFFELVAKVTKKPSKIVIAYDQLQTTTDIQMPQFEELFGLDENGNPNVTLNKENDHILNKSYRNHITILLVALGFGFGIHSQDGEMVQIIKDTENWKALGFKIKGEFENKKELDFGKNIEIIRPIENSPNNIDKLYTKYEILKFDKFNSIQEELDTVCKAIIDLIEIEKVRPQDIMVIDMRKGSKKEFIYMQSLLFSNNIMSNIPGIVDDSRSFIVDENITLTTPRRAKGNEVPIVFVIGAESIYAYESALERRLARNAFFISVTRSKGWSFISGGGKNTDLLEKEFNLIMNDLPLYKFKFPDKNSYDNMTRIDYILKSNKLDDISRNVDVLRTLLKSKDLDLINVMLDDEMKEALKKLVGDE
ncbi:TPA: DEAD/DEAH box helicase [Clostridioides difficile]|nr:DEAD/DEAH box helicase [Clostridioides difficile]